MQGLLGLVEKLLEARHHGVARDRLRPLPDLAVEGEVVGFHLRVGAVARRTDEHPAEGVEVEPREHLRVRRDVLDHRAALGSLVGYAPAPACCGSGAQE